jgi:large subunit ribosomal protein L25
MAEKTLQAEVRNQTGKRAKQTRWNKLVPGVFYARGQANINIQVPAADLDPFVFTAETHVIDLRLPDGAARRCIVKDVQYDPVTDRPIHFDLQGLQEGETLTLEIPVVLTGGIPKGVRDGGMVQHMIHRLKISCLPEHIPQKAEINVSELGINDFVHVSEVSLPNVTILENPENTIVGVLPPTVVKEAAPAVEAEEQKEPEVVGKGKKTEEGESTEGAKAAE